MLHESHELSLHFAWKKPFIGGVEIQDYGPSQSLAPDESLTWLI